MRSCYHVKAVKLTIDLPLLNPSVYLVSIINIVKVYKMTYLV